jgi:predicted metal-dependent HD superfamily phosphohydrolase
MQHERRMLVEVLLDIVQSGELRGLGLFGQLLFDVLSEGNHLQARHGNVEQLLCISMIDLIAQWYQTMKALGAPPADDIANDLIKRWSEPHRHYHTLVHLEHCLREIDALAFESKPIAELAAWFHDAVYVTQPGAANEKESADLARNALTSLGIDPTRICAIVIATEKHASSGDRDGDLFLDVDMCILGQDDATFDAYEAGVRAEWSWVPDPIFRQKRGEFLEMLLARDVIFLTDVMRSRYEAKARANMERSIRSLRV